MKHLTPRIAIALILVFCLLTRLPFLWSKYMILDVDECLVAIMAKHQYYARSVTPFFWGQAYGLTIVETSIIAAFYAIAGISDVVVKLAMLSLWTTGVIFFYLSLQQVNERSRFTPMLLTLFVILSPAWGIWSMKARGGYLTAFTLANVSIYLLFH